ncbi:hypothetical protein D9M71_564300 [compost metagenome]
MTTSMARNAIQLASVGASPALAGAGGAAAGSGNSQWPRARLSTASNTPFSSASMTISDSSKSLAPAAEIRVRPMTRKVASSGLPPLWP